MKKALDAGHSVTAIARTPSKIEETHENLTVIQGNVKRPETLVDPIKGCDVVIDTFGHLRHVQGDNFVFGWHKSCLGCNETGKGEAIDNDFLYWNFTFTWRSLHLSLYASGKHVALLY